ncbi:hypothetical protein [Siphonobacter sp. BAB-5385]|uniref:hypothetical protein n=1 Tax=Siphonobacter sp. BAB-5385 TaxID=1864822 RepID=UPI0034E93357
MKVFFVRTLLMALLGLEVTFAQSNKPLYTFPIGVQAYTYRNEFAKDVEKTLDLIASLGITEIEGNTPKGLTPEAYKQMLQKRKLTIPATGASYEELVSDPQSVIKQAKALAPGTLWSPGFRIREHSTSIMRKKPSKILTKRAKY